MRQREVQQAAEEDLRAEEEQANDEIPEWWLDDNGNLGEDFDPGEYSELPPEEPNPTSYATKYSIEWYADRTIPITDVLGMVSNGPRKYPKG